MEDVVVKATRDGRGLPVGEIKEVALRVHPVDHLPVAGRVAVCIIELFIADNGNIPAVLVLGGIYLPSLGDGELLQGEVYLLPLKYIGQLGQGHLLVRIALYRQSGSP